MISDMGLSEFVNSLDWDQESYPDSSGFWIIPFLALFFAFLRFILDRFVFEKVARQLICRKKHLKFNTTDDKRRKKIEKFKESAWKCLYSLSEEIPALWVTYNEPWFTDTRCYWLGPGDQLWPNQKIKLKLKGLYIYAGGSFVYSFLALFLWETRRSDFEAMVVHHFSAFLLILLSYTFRFARIGSVIMALHGISDVFLETAKISKYIGAEAIADLSFLLFAFSWTALRLVYFPFWVLWSTSYESIMILEAKKNESMELAIYYYVFNTLLFCLLALHIYWWILICRVFFRHMILGRGKLQDIRSDSEGEECEHED